MDFIYTLPLLTIHVTSVIITLFFVVVADLHGLAWILGKLKTLPEKRMAVLHGIVWVGLITTIVAGFLMFTTYSEYLLSLPAFRIKMLLVGMLVLNALFIGKHLRIATETSFAGIPAKEKVILLVSGAVSTVGWIGALIAAQFLG